MIRPLNASFSEKSPLMSLIHAFVKTILAKNAIFNSKCFYHFFFFYMFHQIDPQNIGLEMLGQNK